MGKITNLEAYKKKNKKRYRRVPVGTINMILLILEMLVGIINVVSYRWYDYMVIWEVTLFVVLVIPFIMFEVTYFGNRYNKMMDERRGRNG